MTCAFHKICQQPATETDISTVSGEAGGRHICAICKSWLAAGDAGSHNRVRGAAQGAPGDQGSAGIPERKSMRKIIFICLAAVLACALIAPPEDVCAKDDPKPEADAFRLLRVAGRQWTLKRTPKQGNEGGDTFTTYHHFEVLNVWDDRAEYAQTTLDEGMKAVEGDEFIIKIEFKEDQLFFRDPIGFKKGKIEKVKTAAGTFECTVWSSLGREDGDAYIWRSNDFPGLIVKQDDRFGTREICEFDFVDGDPGFKSTSKKKKKKKGDDEAGDKVDPKKLFSSKGTSWILKTTTERGERGTKTIEVTQYEITKVSDEECELELTKLTQLLQKIKGEDSETRIIKFDDTFNDNLEPIERSREERTELRITAVGLMKCTVYTFKDEEGRDGRVWYDNEWPGLIVRRTIQNENFKQLTEIVKFEE